MMRVYRLSKSKYAHDLRGTGAKRFGGRWNKRGTPCIYSSESRALAVLEYSVNANVDLIPRALSICVFEIDYKRVKEVKTQTVPGNWKEIPAPLSTKEFGTDLLDDGIPILKIPSIVIPGEYNYILNPMTDKNHFKLVDIRDFVFDLRIKSRS